ncbi:MAG: hypothetical protein ACM3JI_03840 [Anaerolineae bacterium]
MFAKIDTCLPPSSGTGFYLQTCKGFGLGDQSDEALCTRLMKATARFILTSIAYRFFCSIGIIYNAVGALSKSVMVILTACSERSLNTPKEYLNQTFEHLGYMGCDFVGKFISPIFSIAYTLSPKSVNQLYGFVEDLIDTPPRTVSI